MGSLSSFNCIRHYILHHHLMQYSELFCVSVVQGSSPREMKMYSSASLLMGKDFSRSLLLIGNASLTQGSKAWIYVGAAKTVCSFPKKSLSWSHPSWGLLAAACPSLGDPVGPCSFRGAGQEPPSSPAYCRWAGGEADLCCDLEQHAEISAAGMFSIKSTFSCCAVIYLFFSILLPAKWSDAVPSSPLLIPWGAKRSLCDACGGVSCLCVMSMGCVCDVRGAWPRPGAVVPAEPAAGCARAAPAAGAAPAPRRPPVPSGAPGLSSAGSGGKEPGEFGFGCWEKASCEAANCLRSLLPGTVPSIGKSARLFSEEYLVA